MVGKYSRRSLLAATGAVAATFSFGDTAQAQNGHRAKPLQFYNWDTYIGPTTLVDFKKRTGTQVNMTLFSSNEELFEKLSKGDDRYDVIVPSNTYAGRMIKAGLLSELDHARLPNLANIVPSFRDPPYDPGCHYTVPYTWLVLGIGYRKSAMPAGIIPDSWKWVFDSDPYHGRIAWSSEADDMMGLAVKYLGYRADDTSPEALAKAEKLLRDQKPHVVFHNDDGQEMLVAGDVDLVIEYNGDIAIRMTEDADLDFVVPREGSRIFTDTWAIPKNARQPEAAHAFLNFMMAPDTDAAICKEILYPTPNAAARALMQPSYRDSPVIFPPQDRLKLCDFAVWPGVDRARAVEAAFNRVRGT